MKTYNMKSMMLILLPILIIPIIGVAHAQTASEIDIATGAGSSSQAICVAANNCFSPNPLTIAPGTTVTWKNTDTTTHVICSGKVTDDQCGSVFEDDALKKGTTFQFTFANAGTFDYFCSVHPWMTGQVIVGAASTTPSTNTTTTTTTTPDNTTAVPEFGPVASIVLAIAVMSMVVFVAKTRGIPKF